MFFFIPEILLMEEIGVTTWDAQHLVNNGTNYQPQLVQDCFHQQYDADLLGNILFGKEHIRKQGDLLRVEI